MMFVISFSVKSFFPKVINLKLQILCKDAQNAACPQREDYV